MHAADSQHDFVSLSCRSQAHTWDQIGKDTVLIPLFWTIPKDYQLLFQGDGKHIAFYLDRSAPRDLGMDLSRDRLRPPQRQIGFLSMYSTLPGILFSILMSPTHQGARCYSNVKVCYPWRNSGRLAMVNACANAWEYSHSGFIYNK